MTLCRHIVAISKSKSNLDSAANSFLTDLEFESELDYADESGLEVQPKPSTHWFCLHVSRCHDTAHNVEPSIRQLCLVLTCCHPGVRCTGIFFMTYIILKWNSCTPYSWMTTGHELTWFNTKPME